MTSCPSRSLAPLASLLALLGFLCAAVIGHAADASTRKAFDLPEGPAPDTLRRYITQSGVQVLYAPEEVNGVRTNAVKGSYTAFEAVQQLVANTGLAAAQTSNGAIAISRAPSPNVQRATPVAQAASDQPALELSPFVITETAETGWVATETLAGSRLRTNFKDVPNQLETLTKDFMADLGVNNVVDALIYTANAENQTEFAPPIGQATNDVNSPATPGRMRGIAAGTLSRNFFAVGNPTDNFNLERVTVASGPNAILFGLGSPVGILDATPARAQMRNKYGFTLQYDSENSKRGTFDANVVAVPEKLAVRLMGMSKREYTDKKPNLDRDERLYGAVTFKPFKGTTLVLQGEKDNRNWNRAPRSVPMDFVTAWYNADKIANSGYTSPRPTFNNTTLTGIGSNRLFAQAGNAPVIVGGNSVSVRSWRNSVTVRNPALLPGVDPTFDAGVQKTLLDRSIFPFDVNILGTGRTNLIGAYTKTIILEQKLVTDLFLELAYNREDSYSHRMGAGGNGSGEFIALNVDANQFIPDSTTPNPNFGKTYFQGQSFTQLNYGEREDWRATLSYDLDFNKKFAAQGGWGRWLGHHRLAALYTENTSKSKSQNFQRRILDAATIPGAVFPATTVRNWATNTFRVPEFRHYFGSSFSAPPSAGSMTGDWTMTDAGGAAIPLYLFDTPLRTPDGTRLGGESVTSGALNKSNGHIFAWQGFFLPDRQKQDRLVLTFGWRKDTVKSADLNNAARLQDFSGLYPVMWDTAYGDFGPSQSGINRNLGIVGRPLKWLSLFYNKSTTFAQNTSVYDPFGERIPGALGDGKDYGVRLDLWDDKLTLRINRYENSQGPQRAANQINVFRNIFTTVENRVLQLDPNIATINVTDGNRRGYPTVGQGNYNIMSDFVSKGYEAELNFSPTPSWNVRVNGAKSAATESNIGKPWFDWVAQRLPVWQGAVAKNGETDASGRPVTWATAPVSANAPTGQTLAQYYESALVGQALAFMQAADGRSTSTARSARANLITNYRFSDGLLKGFNVGGAARWRAAPTIGYGVKTNSSGQKLLDLDRVYKGERELYFDAILGYRGRLKAFGGFAYRLQLNIRNVLNEHDPVPVGTWTTGEVVRLATVDPRVFVFTFGVDF